MNCQEAIDVMGDVLEGAETSAWPGFGEHMRDCTPCRNYLEQLRLTRKALRHLARDRAESPSVRELIDRFREESKNS